MDHDLSKCKVGDWICTAQFGWVQINTINDSLLHPISVVLDGYEETYTLNGFHHKDDKFPSAFIEPPKDWNAEPRPHRFKKDDRVLVRDDKDAKWNRRYFAYEEKGKVYCYPSGYTSWTTKAAPLSWNYIKPWSEEEDAKH